MLIQKAEQTRIDYKPAHFVLFQRTNQTSMDGSSHMLYATNSPSTASTSISITGAWSITNYRRGD